MRSLNQVGLICRMLYRCDLVRSLARMPKLSNVMRRDLRAAAEALSRLGIGGTAVGSGLNAHPEYHVRMVEKLSALTGLRSANVRQLI